MRPFLNPRLPGTRAGAIRTFSEAKLPRRPRPRLSAGGPPLGLDHFLQRSRALGLWREIVRAVNRIADPTTRQDMRRWARDEFERNRGVTDLTQIRYLISTGKTQFDNMRGYIESQSDDRK